MNPRTVRKGIIADDRFIWRYDKAQHVRHHSARSAELTGPNSRIDSKEILASSYRHDDFFHRRVACSFADSVDRTFHLPGAVLHCRQRVSNRHP